MDYASTKMNRIKYLYPDTTHHCTFYEAPQSSNIGSMDFTLPGYSKGKNKEILTNSLFFRPNFLPWVADSSSEGKREEVDAENHRNNQSIHVKKTQYSLEKYYWERLGRPKPNLRSSIFMSLSNVRKKIDRKKINRFFLRLKLPPSLTAPISRKGAKKHLG